MFCVLPTPLILPILLNLQAQSLRLVLLAICHVHPKTFTLNLVALVLLPQCLTPIFPFPICKT